MHHQPINNYVNYRAMALLSLELQEARPAVAERADHTSLLYDVWNSHGQHAEQGYSRRGNIGEGSLRREGRCMG